MERRDFIRRMSALGAATSFSAAARGANGKGAYDPKAKFEIKVFELPFRKTAKGRQLIARVYQPQGKGPFPTVLDLHGGGWVRKDRTANEPMDRAVAASGVLIVAPDLTLAGEAPYPASVQDASYGVRWLKSKAAEWHGDASSLGLIGSSSGGHVAELVAMRPGFPLYNTIPLAGFDDSVAYVATRSPVSDTWARYQQAERKHPNLVAASNAYFSPWENIHEANPMEILQRKEKVTLRPLLIMQGELDDNVLPEAQKKFAEAYRAAGGDVQFEVFKGAVHEWTAEPGPNSDRAAETVKAFIARQLSA